MIRSIVFKQAFALRQNFIKRYVSQNKVESTLFRLIRPDEAANVCTFGAEEMTRTFGHMYSEKDFSEYISEAYTFDKYLEWIKSPSHFVYGAYARKDVNSGNTVAVNNDEELIAYVLAGPCTLPVPQEVHDSSLLQKAGEIKRIYAHPSTFGSGISAHLLVKAMEWLRSGEGQAKRDIYLGVYPGNDRAKKFYAKYNFKHVADYEFRTGSQLDTDHIFRNSLAS